MPRRSRKGLVDDLLTIASRLPWWVSVVIAVALYVGLHAYASREIAISGNPGDVAGAVVQGAMKALAGFGQYALPLIFGIGAVASYWKQRQAVGLVDEVAASETAAALGEMSWQEFEQLVGEAFRLQGYEVKRLGGEGPDGGVDLVLRRGTERTLVQCKQWRAQRVGVEVVRELYGVMAAQRATAGIVVTTGGFTPDAVEFARGRNLRLIEGPELHRMIGRLRSREPGIDPPSPAESKTAASPPSCPRCGKTMVRREAKRGVGAGKPFWGCSSYPACRGTRDI